MEQLFLKVLNLSLYAGLLILAVLLIRVLFRKAPKWISCLFWALVAIRLVCPVTFESPFSVMPAAEKLPTANFLVTEAETEADMETDPEAKEQALGKTAGFVSEAKKAEQDRADRDGVVRSDRSEGYLGLGTTGADLADGNLAEGRTEETLIAADRDADTKAAAKAAATNSIRILAIVWLAGFCAMMAQALFSYLRLKHFVAASIKTRRDVRICDEIEYPFILGIIRPMIYLPGFLSGNMKRFVLAHERAHLKRRDHLWKPLGFFLLAVHWFNPLCWIAYILFSRDLEMACDERVIRNMDRESKADYSQTLLMLSHPSHRIAACPVAFGEIGVKERVKGIFNYKKPAVWIVMLAIVGCIVMAVCFLTSPKKTDTAVAQESETAQDLQKPAEAQIMETENKDAILVEAEPAEETEAKSVPDADISEENAGPLTELTTAKGEVVFSADIDENGVEDHIYSHMLEEDEKQEGDESSILWTLELNGDNIYQSYHDLPCDFDSWSTDLDGDGEAEIFVRIMPYVNSMPLEQYVTLKQDGGAWRVLENSGDFEQSDENGDLSNAFPVKVTVGSEPGTVDIVPMDGQKITVDLKDHYEKMMETEEEGSELYTLADEFLSGDTYKPGDEYGTTAAWGIWEVEGVQLDGKNAIRARQGIQSLKGGKWDILGTLDTYFSYDQNGKMQFLKTEFTRAEE